MVTNMDYYRMGFSNIHRILIIVNLLGKGATIKCPKCGFKFKRPLVQKTIGAGPAPRWMGSYTCPQCKYHGRTSEFVRAADLNNDEK